jgi:hypothetical protein
MRQMIGIKLFPTQPTQSSVFDSDHHDQFLTAPAQHVTLQASRTVTAVRKQVIINIILLDHPLALIKAGQCGALRIFSQASTPLRA